MTPKFFHPPEAFARHAYFGNLDAYRQFYRQSLEDPSAFWSHVAERVTWGSRWSRVCEADFTHARFRWFDGATLNVAENCLDRHVHHGLQDRVAYRWEGDDPSQRRTITYGQLLHEVSRVANVLRRKGIGKGDRVCIYLPMIPELPVAMLACARIGAVHSVVFGGFSAESLKGRIQDSQCKVLITADGGYRGGKIVPLKETADEALEHCPSIESVLVVKRTHAAVPMKPHRDSWLGDEMVARGITDACAPEMVEAEHPLFILYTSGSTGKPKGVLHTTGGYLVYASYTHQVIFDYHPDDIYWCTADIGWVTGHSYIVYGPLCNAAQSVLFEGVPNYPDIGRFWDVVDRHHVNTLYTAPTAIRALMREGEEPVLRRSRKSLKLLGTVGEPINPEAWLWYHRVVGEGRCPIVDTWWQTETGGILISPLPGATPLKPGSATLPYFGVTPTLVNDDGKELLGNDVTGNLCLTTAWPGMMRTVYGDHQRFIDTYFSRFPGKYFTGDGCRRDEDGYHWITGRVDDVINVAGHRLGTAEVESALVSHPSVAEAAVVGMPHEIKGQGIYAYVILRKDHGPSAELEKALVAHVRKEIGPIATPDVIHFTPGLPKTRSGKIMRRILRKIAAGDSESLGDTSTLADPAIVATLLQGARERHPR
ncbi:MAG: acetate--CoA ligase [Planctomycetota bacterium]